MDPEAVRIVALGGLGEVGRNMTVFEYHGKILIVDAGVLFPEEEQPGVDLILPDFSWIEDRMDDVVAGRSETVAVGGVQKVSEKRIATYTESPVGGDNDVLAAFRDLKLAVLVELQSDDGLQLD